MGFLYTVGVFLLLIAVWVFVDRFRLLRMRRERESQGFTRSKFIEAFRELRVPDSIPAAVFDYYASQKAWKGFPFSPDDRYAEILHDDPLELDEDARALVERLGMLFLPEYVLRVRGDKPIETLRDMVVWLEWVRQHQPATR